MTDRPELLAAALADLDLSERIIRAIYERVVRPGDVVVDGGAHLGGHTLPLAELVGPGGHVVAVEPVPETATILRARAEYHGFPAVEVIEAALSDATGMATFHVDALDSARSSLAAIPGAGELREIEVARIRLDDLMGERGWRFGKFDLEGGEYHAFRGGRQTIRRCRPLIVFERAYQAADWFAYTPGEFLSLFEELGYRVRDLFGAPITLSDWAAPERPWYAVAASVGSADDTFLDAELPGILDTFMPAGG